MLVHIKKLIEHAKKHNYCLGAFNIHNIESIKGIIEAAKYAKSPAIIQTSEGSINTMGIKSAVSLVRELTMGLASNIPFALHLDHGKNTDLIFKCINEGFSSVHIDASAYDLLENIKITKKVVNYAKKKNVWVQGEIGVIKGGHGIKAKKIGTVPLANPECVIEFVKATKVNTISAAIGTAHGSYEDENISFELLKNIKSKIKNKPFVLHGGSGVANYQIKKSIKMGVNIINVGTDIKVAFCESVIRESVNNKKETDPRKLLFPAIKSVKKVVARKMKLFGSSNKVK